MKQLRTKSINWARALTAALLVLLASTGAQAIEESQVTLLQAIKSTGAQAFNTGYTHKANTRVELDCEVTMDHQKNFEALFGGRLGHREYNAFCFFSRYNSVDNPCFNRTGQETIGTGFVYGERIKLVCEGQTATWYKYSDLNTVAGSVTTEGTADDGKTPMFLFNLNTSGTEGGSQVDTSPSVMTLYGCKIYEGSTLMRDYVPAKYNNVVGLYDRVNKTFSGSITSTAFLAVNDPAPNNQADYERALAAIEDGKGYRIYTMYNGQKYYVTADGKLSTAVTDASPFEFSKVAPKSSDGDGEYEYGFQVKLHKNGYTYYFSNSDDENGKKLKVGYLNIRKDYSRTTWEAQVFFLNAEGKYAVRCTNAKSGDSGWNLVGSAFWTVDADTNGPLAQYDYDMNYVWELEEVFCISTNGTAGTSTSENYDKLVDGNKSTKWCVSSFSSAFVEFHTPRAITPTGYVLTTGGDNATWKGRNPKSWTIKAKAHISDNWTTLATVTNDNTMQDVNTTDYEFSIDNDEAYQYFRFDVSAVQSGTIFQLSEFAFLYNDVGVQTLDYNRALKAIEDGGRYRIFTMVGTQKYYLTGEGKLSTDVDDAPLFTFTKVAPKSADGDGEYENGFQIKNGSYYFTNSSEEDGSSLKEGHICVTNKNKRTTWEAQVFFLNTEGKFAVRSTNAKSGDTGWAKVGTAFWTVNAGPKAEYSWDMNYVWELESGSGETEAYTGFATIDNIYYNLNGKTKTAEVTFKDKSYGSYSGDVTVPEKVTYQGTEYTVASIGVYAFYKSSDLTSVSLPGTVTALGNWAFDSCTGLTTFTVPKTVTSMGYNPFYGCDGLTSLTVESGNPKFDSRDGCNAIIDTKADSLVSACNATVIPDDVKVLGFACFGGLNISSIVIPNSVETIGEYAFYNCTNLSSVTLSENLKTIDYEAFYYCYSLTDLRLPEGLETIGDYAFCYCDNLSSVSIPKSVKTIGEVAFYYCDNLIRIISSLTDPCETDEYCFNSYTYTNAILYVPVGTKSKYEATDYWNQFQNIVEGEYREIAMADGRRLCYIINKESKTAEVTFGKYAEEDKDDYAYSGEVSIPDKVVCDGVEYTVTRIGGYAFRNCKELTSVTIPSSVTSIGIRSFQYCDGLTSVTVPSSVTSIENFAFNTMAGLTSVTLSEGLTSIGNAVFGGDKLLTTITIPASVTSIGHFPFWGCDGLKTLQVASGSTKYDSRGGCNAIIETETNKLIQGCNVTVIPDDVVTIAQAAFYGFAGLNTVVIPQSVTNIEMEAFRVSTGLTSVVIPSSVTSIGEYAFYDCANLVEVHSQVETPFEIAENVFSKSDGSFTTATLYVPVGTSEAYRDSNYWSKFTNIEEETYVITYPVWVGETQVTEANKDDVLGDGNVEYDPKTSTLTFSSGTTTINGMYNAAKIYADGINLTIDAPKGLFIENFVYGIYMSGANSELTVNGDLTFKTSQNPIYSSSRININGNLTAAEGYTGINAKYIAVNGNVNMKLSTYCINASEIVLNGTKHELSASSPCLDGTNITVTGDLTATSNNTPAINAKGDVTLVSGTWTLDGGNIRAIELGSNANLNIPSTYAIIEPEEALIKSFNSGNNAYKTIVDADSNEATHVVIGEAKPDVAYTVTITGGKAYAQEPDPYELQQPVTEFKAGATVYVVPNAVYGKYVTGWETSSDISITEKELIYHFKMPAENVTMTPLYSEQTPLTWDLSDGKQVRIGDNEDDLMALEGLLLPFWQKGQLLANQYYDYFDLDLDGTNDITLYEDEDTEELVIEATDGTNLTGIYYTENNISPFGPIRFKFSPEMLDEDSPEPTNLDKLTELGQEMSVILKRTLRAGGWNTFASPVTFSDFTNVFGEGVKVKQLKDATLTDGVLNLKFEDATTIEGFTPYLVKVAADVDLSQKTITGIVCDEPVIKETAALKFIPTMGLPQNSHTDDPKSVLFIGAGSKLYYADALPLDIKGFRAYFVLNEPDAVRSVRMDFGDDGGATLMNSVGVNSEQLADEWYSVDGRKLSGRPTAKGVYINNGKKTIVK